MQRLSGLDAVFLSTETDTVPMHVGALLILDPARSPGFGITTIRAALQARLHLVPAFRRRPVFAPMNLIHPVWIEDPDFDLDRHLFRTELPAPGTHAQLESLVGELYAPRLPRDRPLWQIHCIEGLAKGRIALLWKVSHACFDGVLGAGMFSKLLDVTPDAPPPPPPERPWTPDRIPGEVEMLAWTARSTLAAPGRLIKLAQDTAQAIRTLRQNSKAPAPALGPADSLPRARLPLLAPPCRFNTAITARRSYAFGSFSMKAVKAVKTAFDATVNDVIVTLCAQAARDYLLRYGGLPAKPLLAAIPISIRRKDDEAATNQVVVGRVNLATDIADPAERLRILSSRLKRVKRANKSLPAHLLLDWLEVPLPLVLARVAQLNESWGVMDHVQVPVNLVISNIPGPQQPLYLAGAKVEALYPASITYHGLGLNITLMSYCEQLHVGITAHPGTVPDVGYFLGCMRRTLSQLRRGADEPPPTSATVRDPGTTSAPG